MPRPTDIPAALQHYAPPPRRVRYARVGTAGPFPLPRMVLEETWGEPQERDGRVVFRRTARDVEDGRLLEDALIGYGEDGLTDLGVFDGDALALWSPPQVVLCPDPAAGATWTATHVRGERQSARSVQLDACTQHTDCLVVVSESKLAAGTLVMRQHYTGGEGFVGYESMAMSPGQPPVRTWSESVSLTLR